MNSHGVMVIEGKDVLDCFNEQWDTLVTATPQASIFQTSNWCRCWTELVADAEQATPLLLAFRHQGRLRGVLPLQKSQVGDRQILRPLSWPWADYHEALVNPGDEEAIQGLAYALDCLSHERDMPFIIDDIVPGGIWEKIGGVLGATLSASSPTASIDLRNNALIDQIQGRREHLTKWRRLGRLGNIVLRHYSEPSSVHERMKYFIDMHRSQWSGRDDAVAPFDGGVVDRAFYGFVDFLAPYSSVLLTELAVDGKPVAMYFGFLFKKHYLGYRTAFELDFFRYSPGHLMLQGMIDDFRRKGLEELDLMRGGYAYKGLYVNGFAHNLCLTGGRPI